MFDLKHNIVRTMNNNGYFQQSFPMKTVLHLLYRIASSSINNCDEFIDRLRKDKSQIIKLLETNYLLIETLLL